MFVKFCGLKTQEDVVVASALGVDAVGLVFYEKSPRFITIADAAILSQKIPAFVSAVALVVNMPAQKLQELAKKVRFDIIQFHGDETPIECQRLACLVHKRWIKAIRVQPCDTQDDILQKINELAQYGASGVILDTFSNTAFGGTGLCFDWNTIPKNSPLPIYLAGGLNPDNIGDVANNHELMDKIAGVDVSGGIEREKGIKCSDKMKDFIQNIYKNTV